MYQLQSYLGQEDMAILINLIVTGFFYSNMFKTINLKCSSLYIPLVLGAYNTDFRVTALVADYDVGFNLQSPGLASGYLQNCLL